MTDFLYNEVVGKIISSSMKVYSAIGNCFQEVEYKSSISPFNLSIPQNRGLNGDLGGLMGFVGNSKKLMQNSKIYG